MVYHILIPRLGWNMEEGTFVEWLKQDGTHVQAGEPVCTIEGDKASMEIESFETGILHIPPDAPAPGATVPVGTLLGYVVPEDEVDSFVMPPAGKAAGVSNVSPAHRTAASAHRAYRRSDRAVPTISPRARRIAGELGVNWQRLTGSGRSGRIVERDVRAAAGRLVSAEQTVPPDTETTVRDVSGTAAEPEIAAVIDRQEDRAADLHGMPMSAVRRIVAERMSASAHTAAPVTLTTEADVTALVRLRNRLIEELRDRAPAYHDMFAKLTAIALNDYPELNASLDGDKIIYHDRVNIGIATETDQGLLVPVVRDVDIGSLIDIAAVSSRLIEEARNGEISLGHLQDGTFTISNLGMYDIDAFTPIINLPECAILGVGRIEPKVVVVDEETATIGIRKMMALSLTFDHRIVDGGPAARFLQRVKRLIEQPEVCYER